MAATMLSTVVGAARASDYDTAVNLLLDETPPSFVDQEWYVTIVLERPLEVDAKEDQLNEGRYFWIDPRALEGLDEPLRTEAPAALDLVVAAIAPILGPGVFNGGIDRFFFSAKDRGRSSFLDSAPTRA
jgi:hypothetical protein